MWNVIVLGVILNAAAGLLLKPLRGIDAMPALPIIAGYLYGTSAGLLAGVLIASSYYVFNLRSIHYSPLTVTANAVIGALASFFAGVDILFAGIFLLVVYHVLSGAIVSIFGGLRPGYFAFVLMNIAVSVVIFYISSFVL